MAVIKTVRRNVSGNASSNRGAEYINEELLLERTIYQRLSNLTTNKTLVLPEEIKSKFDRFLVDMEEYSNTGIAPYEALQVANEYLGELGLTKEYSFSQDMYDIDNWLGDIVGSDARGVTNELDSVYFDTDRIIYTGA